MPFKVWAPGDEMTAGDVNTYLGNQVVPTFTDATQRAAQLDSPDKGQLSALDTYAGALWMWDGSAWVEPAAYSQSGYHTQTLNAGAGGAVDYPKPFAAGGVAIHMTNADDDTGTFGMQFSLIGTQNFSTGFGFIGRYTNGTLAVSAAVKMYWTAIGYRAVD